MSKLIYIPCYNCEIQILRMLQDILLYDKNLFESITFIDNASSDNTLIVLRNFKRDHTLNYRIISHAKNYGLGGSFKTSVRDAKANGVEKMIWYHGDYQAKLPDLKKMKSLSLSEDFDCIFGSRFMSNSQLINYSKSREIGNKIIIYIYSIFLRERIFELGSGLNMYKLKHLEENIERWPNHIAFDANLLFLFIKKKICWMPIVWENLDQVSNARNFRVACDLLVMLFTYVFGKGRLSLQNEEVTREYIIYE